jgi:hypothetical protein
MNITDITQVGANDAPSDPPTYKSHPIHSIRQRSDTSLLYSGRILRQVGYKAPARSFDRLRETPSEEVSMLSCLSRHVLDIIRTIEACGITPERRHSDL